MKNYYITIIETLEKEIEVPAESISDAFDTVREQYNNSEIVLDADCHTGTNFKATRALDRGAER